MSRNTTNIRYHLFKEFLKHRSQISKSNIDKVNEFAVPVFSGVETGLLIAYLGNCYGGDTNNIQSFLLYLIGPALVYYGFYKVTYWLIKCYKTRISPRLRQTNDCDTNDIEERTKRIAKFDYEVTELVQSSYELITKEVKDQTMSYYNLMQSIFYANCAIDDLRKSLIPQNTIPTNRIKYVLYTLREAVSLQFRHEKSNMFEEEITRVVTDYNKLASDLRHIYQIKIETIITYPPVYSDSHYWIS